MSASTSMAKTNSIREPLDAVVGRIGNHRSRFGTIALTLRCFALQRASLQIRERLFHSALLVGRQNSAYSSGAVRTLQIGTAKPDTAELVKSLLEWQDRTQAEGGARWRQ
jgi:hypothetical protein